MIYIIDANNLAGKLGILKNVDFDKQLIDIMRQYNNGKGKKIFLVFDGVDRLGDKYEIENITIIRSPKDDNYKTADDKIVELAQNISKNVKDNLVVITNDLGIKDLIVKNNLDNEREIKIVKATDFAKQIDFKQDSEQYEDDKKLDDNDVDKINSELLKIWKDK